MTQPRALDLVVLPPVAADPVFSEPLPLARLIPSPRLGHDPQDFAALFIRHKWSFSLHARRFLSDQRDIDEVVQEGFLKLFLALPELETELQALAYCRRTITNLCIDRYRADQRRPHLIDLENILQHPLTEEDETDPLIQAEDAVVVREALAMLSPLHRAALIKREVEEKPLPQIALELDIPVEQVKHVLHRARRALRRLLVGTHVEPGVDLDLASVLQANRKRAAQAAKPTSAAALAILVILAGFFGLRPAPTPRILEGAPATVPFGSLLPQPDRSASIPAASAPTRSPLGSSPLPSTARAQLPAGAPTRGAPLRPPAGQPAPSARPSAGSTSSAPSAVPTRPPVVGPVPVPTGVPTVLPTGAPTPPAPARAAYVISGVDGSGQPAVSQQQSIVRSFGTSSTSVLSVGTPDGTYALRQGFQFTSAGALLGVSLNEVVPISSQATIGTLVSSTSSSVNQLVGGAVQIHTSGTATPVGVATAMVAPLPGRVLTVDVTLAPDLAQVLSETLTVSASPTSPAPLWAPTGGPIVAPAPAGLPLPPAVLAPAVLFPVALPTGPVGRRWSPDRLPAPAPGGLTVRPARRR